MKRLLILLTLIFLGGTFQRATAAPALDAYDLINGINILRASYGLPELEVSPNLMEAAQAQSNYQASNKTVTHLDETGATIVVRAVLYGYGGGTSSGVGGSEIVVAENVYGAFGANAVTAISEWSQNPRDLQNMLNPHTHIGAGEAINNGVVYYTLVVGHLANAPGVGIEATPGSGDDPLFVVSPPRADGSIVHLVGFGQTLILIAEKYATTVENLLLLNNLNADSVIFPGQELIIQLPTNGPTFTPSGPTFTPNPTTPTVTVLPTIEPTRTPRPTRTLSPEDRPTSTLPPGSTTIPTSTPPPTPIPTPSPILTSGNIRLALIVLIVVAAGLVLAGNVFDKRKGDK
ncbi:MAG: CAP domain-containing protein [Anaerolineales bacterium]|nr:CAP domain-containing protein [Anaerolineales bacterium]